MLTADKKKYTIDDYLMLEEGAPFQLINYDLIMSPSPLPIHQQILYALSEIIVLYNIQHGRKGQWLYSPMDVKFDEGNIVQPDILYIAEDRKKELIKDRIEGAPDLIVEILSPSNAYYDLRQKKDIYEKYGVKEYIIIDPIQQNADLYILKERAYVLEQKAQLTEVLKSVLLPGFDIEVSKLFQ
ncbi:Uma2 family endonuclease [Mucilaginibacter rubeus]|uniref:Uma2 family endonuclease n=1 Tax=Mucilaginibacter rubeus TaxID=2027860 RepID=A0AAE6MKZ4_9SPHI|nr:MULTISPECIES: Uma2 family endonuclease [Mucilaginibacter]QEM07009.1 Uma2 family endonuclease [Mucilaginibacter rubeus]QEM19597.1 Uma2 family endonuclease [Mucilaginibacter gossypii]QTE43850.1 Uma2 family endonuclease [Mucilaginibacter rubeus]QTE50451.1 Uma2 family endonuclease [Mucilaginibacter rubeus]QTE55536.1 Uma2 family endonuclease [Mucilaginibacter rubeus]